MMFFREQDISQIPPRCLPFRTGTLHPCRTFAWFLSVLAVWLGSTCWITGVGGFTLGKSPSSMVERTAGTSEECVQACLQETSLPCHYVKFYADSGLCLMTAHSDGAQGFQKVRAGRRVRESPRGKKKRRKDDMAIQTLANEVRHLKHIIFTEMLQRNSSAAPEEAPQEGQQLEQASDSAQALRHYAHKMHKNQRKLKEMLREESQKARTLQRRGQRSDASLVLVMKVLISHLNRDRDLRRSVRRLQQALSSLQGQQGEGNATSNHTGQEGEKERGLQEAVARLAVGLRDLQERSSQQQEALASLETGAQVLQTFKKRTASHLLRLATIVANNSEQLVKIESQLPREAGNETESGEANLTEKIQELQSQSSGLTQALDRHARTLARLTAHGKKVQKTLGSLAQSSAKEMDRIWTRLQSLTQRVKALHSALEAAQASSNAQDVSKIPSMAQRQSRTQKELKDTENELHKVENSLKDVVDVLKVIRSSKEKERVSTAKPGSPKNQTQPSKLSILEQEKNAVLKKLEKEAALLKRRQQKKVSKHNQGHHGRGKGKLEELSKEIEKEKEAAKVENFESHIFLQGSKLAKINSQIAKLKGDAHKASEELERAEDLQLEAEEAKLQSKLSIKTALAEQGILEDEQQQISSTNTEKEGSTSTKLLEEKPEATETLQSDKETSERELETKHEESGKSQLSSKDKKEEQLAKDVHTAEEIAHIKSLESKLLKDRAQIAQLSSKIAKAEGKKEKAQKSREKADDLRDQAEEVKLTSKLSRQTAKTGAVLLHQSQLKHAQTTKQQPSKSGTRTIQHSQHDAMRDRKEREKLRKDILAAEEQAKVTKAEAQELKNETKVAELNSETK